MALNLAVTALGQLVPTRKSLQPPDLLWRQVRRGLTRFGRTSGPLSTHTAIVKTSQYWRDLPRHDASEVTSSRHFVSSPDAHRRPAFD
jgi:hypothetical protein